MTTRVFFEAYLLQLAVVAAKRGTCSKRQVGAVVADANNQIVAVSYNGPPQGQPHSIDKPCLAMQMSAPQSHLACRSIHAEANALLQAGPRARGGTMAITTSPCYACALLIANQGVSTLVVGDFNRLYDAEGRDIGYSESPRLLLESAGVAVIAIFGDPSE